MPFLEDPVFAAGVAIVLMFVTGGVATITLMEKHATRLSQLRQANRLLEEHAGYLRALDTDETPTDILRLALFASVIFTDREALEKIMATQQEAPQLPYETEAKAIPMSSEASMLVETNPAMAEAFINCLMTAIRAAELRWPECAGRLGHPFHWPSEEVMRSSSAWARLMEGLAIDNEPMRSPSRFRPA